MSIVKGLSLYKALFNSFLINHQREQVTKKKTCTESILWYLGL